MNTYTEYGVVVDDGPSRGFVLKTSRSCKEAERLRDLHQKWWQEKLVVMHRTVTVTVSEWERDTG